MEKQLVVTIGKALAELNYVVMKYPANSQLHPQSQQVHSGQAQSRKIS